MNNKNKFYHMAILCFVLAHVFLYGQKNEIQIQETHLQVIVEKIDTLKQRGLRFLGEAEIIAQRISLYQAQGRLNRKQHRNLEKQLRQSQILEVQIQDVESQIDTLYQKYLYQGKILLDLYRKQMDPLLQKIETEKKSDHKIIWLTELNGILAKKGKLEDLLYPLHLNRKWTLTIEAGSWDTSGDLRMKGDMLSDRVSMVRDEAQLVERKIHSLVQEASARKRAEELTEEINLFDEREELLAREAGSAQTTENNFLDYWDTEEFGPPRNESVNHSEPWNPVHDDLSLIESESGTNGRPSNRNFLSIEQSISQLENHRNQLYDLADSLSNRAAWFYEQSKSK